MSNSSCMGKGSDDAEKRRIVARFAVCLVLLIAWAVFIFAMSAENGDASQGMSDGFIVKMVSLLYPDYARMCAADQAALVESFSFPIRKTAHFTEYLIFGCLAFAAFLQARALRGKTSLGAAAAIPPFALSVLYASFDEFHQTFVDGRSGQPFDVGVDSAGALVGIAVFLLILRACRKGQKGASFEE